MNDTYTLVLNTNGNGVYNDPSFNYYTPTDRWRTWFVVDWTFLPTNVQYFNVEFEFLSELNYYDNFGALFQNILIETNFQNLTSSNTLLGCAEILEDSRNLYTRHLSKFKDNAPVTIYRPIQNLKVDIMDSSLLINIGLFDVQYTLTLHFTPVLERF
jgi:hypothetical protein